MAQTQPPSRLPLCPVVAEHLRRCTYQHWPTRPASNLSYHTLPYPALSYRPSAYPLNPIPYLHLLLPLLLELEGQALLLRAGRQVLLHLRRGLLEALLVHPGPARTDGRTDRQTRKSDRQTDRQTDKTDRQTDGLTATAKTNTRGEAGRSMHVHDRGRLIATISEAKPSKTPRERVKAEQGHVKVKGRHRRHRVSPVGREEYLEHQQRRLFFFGERQALVRPNQHNLSPACDTFGHHG